MIGVWLEVGQGAGLLGIQIDIARVLRAGRCRHGFVKAPNAPTNISHNSYLSCLNATHLELKITALIKSYALIITLLFHSFFLSLLDVFSIFHRLLFLNQYTVKTFFDSRWREREYI